jgi:hypothetical protein
MRGIVVLLMMWLAGAASANVSGEWSISGAFDAESVAKGTEQQADLVCYLKQEHEALTGECRPADGPGGVPIAGTVRGDEIEWRFDIALGPDSKKQTVTYKASINDAGTRMKGTFSIADRRGAFTAERQQ